MCQNMKWAHLPVAGGLYDQSPTLLEKWRIIFAKQAEQQEREANKPVPRGRKKGRTR